MEAGREGKGKGGREEVDEMVGGGGLGTGGVTATIIRTSLSSLQVTPCIHSGGPEVRSSYDPLFFFSPLCCLPSEDGVRLPTWRGGRGGVFIENGRARSPLSLCSARALVRALMGNLRAPWTTPKDNVSG